MPEEFLNKLPINDLLALLLVTRDELKSMHNEGSDAGLIEQKKKEIELLQQVIVAKRAAETPGK